MGILLPPVSQVTNTRINLTQHHRNRSLDSALQRIPEVSRYNIKQMKLRTMKNKKCQKRLHRRLNEHEPVPQETFETLRRRQ